LKDSLNDPGFSRLNRQMSMRPSIATRLENRIRWEALRLIEGHGDRSARIDASWGRPAGALGGEFEAAPYEAVSYGALKAITRRLKLGPDEVVCDVGCGKGRAVCWFATQKIKKSIGIELDPVLAATADLNAGRLLGRRAPIQIKQGDAREQCYLGVTTLFMFNPFGPKIMSEVLDCVNRDREGRALQIVYVNPVAGDVLDRMDWLKRGESFDVANLLVKMKTTVWRSI
jgi:hypothetical protein